MATRPELNPNSGAAMAMNDDVGRIASRIRYSASRTPRNCGYAYIVGMQSVHSGAAHSLAMACRIRNARSIPGAYLSVFCQRCLVEPGLADALWTRHAGCVR